MADFKEPVAEIKPQEPQPTPPEEKPAETTTSQTPINLGEEIISGMEAVAKATAEAFVKNNMEMFRGERGFQGDRGFKGEDGTPGSQGERGERGTDGRPGKDGKDGAPGKDGQNGKSVPKWVIGLATIGSIVMLVVALVLPIWIHTWKPVDITKANAAINEAVKGAVQRVDYATEAAIEAVKAEKEVAPATQPTTPTPVQPTPQTPAQGQQQQQTPPPSGDTFDSLMKEIQ